MLPVTMVVEDLATADQAWLRLVPWESFTSRHSEGEIGYDFAEVMIVDASSAA